MKITKTPLGCTLIELEKFYDERGYFYETYNYNNYKEFLKYSFVQDNVSFSKKNVLRGLHFQTAIAAQGKLIQVLSGEIYDVAVDIRLGSPTYGQWEFFILNGETQVFIPPGFAHGFLSLEDSLVCYKVTNHYNKPYERCIIYNDETLNIQWPIDNLIVSEKDLAGMKFKDIYK